MQQNRIVFIRTKSLHCQPCSYPYPTVGTTKGRQRPYDLQHAFSLEVNFVPRGGGGGR